MPTNFTALSKRNKMRAVVSSAGFRDLAAVVPADRPFNAGTYPALLSLAVAVAARVWGSQSEALTNLDESLWTEITDWYSRRLNVTIDLPVRPPTARQQDGFIADLATHPKLLKALSTQFTLSAVGQASYMGNFRPMADPDFTRLDARNVVMGDGTFYKPYSDVYYVDDPITGERRYYGSRASKRAPRVQALRTEASLDDKVAVGVNHVTLLTQTEYGWIVLANEQAAGAEIHAAENAIESVQPLLGDRLHGIVWDRAITGFHIEWFMAQHRILVVNKSVARNRQVDHLQDGYTPLRLSEDDAVDRWHHPMRRLPLGTSVYRTTAGFDVVSGKVSRYKRVRVDDCIHDLWVDDGALVDVEYTDGHYWKRAHATALSSYAQRGPHGTWQLVTEWRLPCATGAPGEHRIPTVWKPRQVKSQDHEPYQRTLSELRTIPRQDDVNFQRVHGLRNLTESYNAWAKTHLGNGVHNGRAMRLNTDAQFLDHLCTGVLANAITAWRHNHRRH